MIVVWYGQKNTLRYATTKLITNLLGITRDLFLDESFKIL